MLDYELTENDYLVFQLYLASKSKNIIRKRILSILLTPICWIITSIILQNLFNLDINIVLIMSIMSALWLIIYPIRTHFFIFISKGTALIVKKTINTEALEDFIKKISDLTQLKIIDENKWKWI
jgi:hypothetical protein